MAGQRSRVTGTGAVQHDHGLSTASGRDCFTTAFLKNRAACTQALRNTPQQNYQRGGSRKPLTPPLEVRAVVIRGAAKAFAPGRIARVSPKGPAPFQRRVARDYHPQRAVRSARPPREAGDRVYFPPVNGAFAQKARQGWSFFACRPVATFFPQRSLPDAAKTSFRSGLHRDRARARRGEARNFSLVVPRGRRARFPSGMTSNRRLTAAEAIPGGSPVLRSPRRADGLAARSAELRVRLIRLACRRVVRIGMTNGLFDKRRFGERSTSHSSSSAAPVGPQTESTTSAR